MSGFLAAMTEEMGARRRRLRDSFGDRGQGFVEFLVLGGLAMGSLGLFLYPGMARAAPWGFALPFVFVIGFLLIERRRQRAVAREEDAAAVATKTDWTVFLWSFACALAGVAAFVLAWQARPIGSPEEWRPPAGTVDSTLVQPNP